MRPKLSSMWPIMGPSLPSALWGYNSSEGVTQLPASLKEAMDYFIQYAGCDNQGNQKADSPDERRRDDLAAGNEDKEFEAFPASYPKVISVSSMAWDFSKASYSNYADWVSIMAPGGDQDVNSGFQRVVYSAPFPSAMIVPDMALCKAHQWPARTSPVLQRSLFLFWAARLHQRPTQGAFNVSLPSLQHRRIELLL